MGWADWAVGTAGFLGIVPEGAGLATGADRGTSAGLLGEGFPGRKRKTMPQRGQVKASFPEIASGEKT